MSQRLASSAVLAALFVTTGTPARSEMCGPPAALTVIEKRTIQVYPGKGITKRHSVDATYIQQLDVVDGYGFSLTGEDMGQIAYFWFLDSSGWHYVGPWFPSSWPAAIKAHFTNDVNSMGWGKPRCLNPKFVPRGGG